MLSDIQGTPAYWAPELFQESADGSSISYHGFPVDVWALGAMLYTLVAGVPPFMADSRVELARKVRNEPFRLAGQIRSDPHLSHLLHRMMDKSPTTRITLDKIIKHEVGRGMAWPWLQTTLTPSCPCMCTLHHSFFSFPLPSNPPSFPWPRTVAFRCGAAFHGTSGSPMKAQTLWCWANTISFNWTKPMPSAPPCLPCLPLLLALAAKPLA